MASARIDAEKRIKGSGQIQKMFGVGLAAPKLNRKGIPDRSRYSSEKYIPLLEADFLISDKCCAVMKKTPLNDFQAQKQMYPFIGSMAEESMLRRQNWLNKGCNVFSGGHQASRPMSFWKEQDVLRYIVEKEIKIADIYGEILPMKPDGQLSLDDTCQLRCTGAERTGCIYCPFGTHHENLQSEGRFIRLARTHPKQYAYVMNGGAYDPEDGYWKPTKEGLGFAHVFDEMNRLLPTKTGRPFIRYRPEGDEMEKARKLAEEKEKRG